MLEIGGIRSAVTALFHVLSMNCRLGGTGRSFETTPHKMDCICNELNPTLYENTAQFPIVSVTHFK